MDLGLRPDRRRRHSGPARGDDPAAQAKVAPKPLVARTLLHNRLDSGGNSYWAYNNFTRTLILTYLGKSTDPAHAAAPYMYYGQIDDSGTFMDIPGAFTPNQGGHYLGRILLPKQVSGPMSGYGEFGLFYASAKASTYYVPQSIPARDNSLYPSSTWVELAFPVGTTFAGVNEATFSYPYSAVPFR